jgi:hypothetical protein
MARMSDVTVRDNPAELRYEARRGDIWLGIVFGLGPVLYEHESSLTTLGLRFNF